MVPGELSILPVHLQHVALTEWYYGRTRQIKDLEFQLVLPGQPIVPKEPLSPPKSGKPRRTPQTREKRGPRSSTRKPVTARKKGAGKPSSSDIPISEDQEGVRGTIPTQSGRGGKAAKKPKTGVKMTDDVINTNGLALVMDERPVIIHEEQGELSQANEEISQPFLQAHGKKRKDRKPIEQNSSKKPRLQTSDGDREDSEQPPEDASGHVNHQEEASVDSQNREIKEPSQNSAKILAIGLESLPHNSAQDSNVEEVQNLTLTSIKSPTEHRPRRKKRKSIGQQKPRRKVSEVATAGDSIHSARSDAAEAAPEAQHGSSTVKKSRGRGRPRKILSTIDVGDVQGEVLQATSSTDVARNTNSAGDRDQSKKIPSSTEVVARDGVRTNIHNSNVTRNARTARGRGRPRKGIPAGAVVQDEGESENGANEDHRPVEKLPTRKRGRPKLNVATKASEASTTVKKRKIMKKDARDLNAIDGKIPSASRQPPENSMPITGYRMSTNDALDSEHNHPESPTKSSALSKNDNVNAVDALAQICQELVSKSTESLDEVAKNERNKTKKATLERKRKNIEAYGEELDNRLFQLVSEDFTKASNEECK